MMAPESVKMGLNGAECLQVTGAEFRVKFRHFIESGAFFLG